MFATVNKALFESLQYTVGLFFSTLVVAIPLGIIICLCSMSKFKPLKWLTEGFIWIIRGTPLMLQIFVIFYIFPMAFKIGGLDRFPAAIVAFGINYAAYFAVIFKGGIQGVPQGQYEAASVLGMKRTQIASRIVFPQVCKRIVQPMSNEVITLVKDTSLANVIGIAELIFTAKGIMNKTGQIWPLFYTGIFYLAMCGLVTIAFHFIEKSMNYYKI